MERTVEETMQRVKMVYEMVTGQPASDISSDTPYARIPPEVDREEHVLRQAAALFERVRDLGKKEGADTAPQFGSDVASKTVQPFGRGTISAPIGMYREGNDLRFVFDVANTPRERITVELQGPQLRVSCDRASQPEGAETERFDQSAYLPVRVDPAAVAAELTDGFLTVRVRIPVIDDAIHKIEIR